jgi:hypothetical protein
MAHRVGSSARVLSSNQPIGSFRAMAPNGSAKGTTLPAGMFTITAEEDARLAQALESPPGARSPHPAWAYIATQRGIGISVADLCALADFDVAEGPMLGSVDIDLDGALELDVPYTVTGEIVDLVRKEGKSGTFDILTFREHLSTPDGVRVASTTNAFILPRRSA